MPGVHAVLTHEDVPGEKRYGLEFRDQPVLAFDRVRYFGEPVAIVAAEEPEQARRAAAEVKVDYEELEPVTDPERAPDAGPDPPGALDARARLPRRPAPQRRPLDRHPARRPRRAGRRRRRGTYELGIQDQAFLGPESGLAVPDGEGGVDIYVATQWLHVDRDQVAPCLGLPKEQVRIHLAGVGGAFGGREDLSMQIHGAMLALHTNRPVKFVYNREESFVGHIHRHPARIRMEHRANRDGKLVNVRARHPARRRRLRLQLDRRLLERGLLRLRALRGAERLHRSHVRLHQQPAVRRHARLRRRPVELRARGADGQARRRARARPRRAPPAQRARPRGHAARPGRRSPARSRSPR